MAKQSGLVKLSGRIEGQSFYYNKNGGYLTRTINTGMSGRVKTDAAYANTRKNNAEFGAAGASAGLIMRTIPKKFRYILQSTATGILNKAIKAQLALDPTGLWGQRQVPTGGQQKILQSFNVLSKNPMNDEIHDFLNSHLLYDATAHKLFTNDFLTMPASFVENMESIGANAISIYYYGLSVDMPVFDASSLEYNSASATIVEIGELKTYKEDVSVGGTLVPAAEVSLNMDVLNSNPSKVTGVFVVFTPLRKIGEGYNTLQEHCSAIWIPATAGTVE